MSHQYDPVTPVRKADGTYAYSVYSDTDVTNPVNAIEQTYDSWTTNRVVGNVYGVVKFTNDISLRSTYSVDATFATQNGFRPRFDLSNDPLLSDAPAQEKNLVNSVSVNNNTWKNWPGSPDASTTFPQYMIVDYIRMFQ